MTDIFTMAVEDGIATITWDLPGASMNVLSIEGVHQLDALVDKVIADEGIKGAIITSAKPDFAAGMDLNVIASTKQRAAEAGGNVAEGVFNMVMDLHGVLRKIERGGAIPRRIRAAKCSAGRPRHSAGHRLRDRPGLPSAHRRREPQGQDRSAGNPGRYLPGRWRHHPPDPDAWPDGLGRAAVAGQDLRAQEGQGDDADRQGGPDADLLAEARAWVANATEADAVKPWDEKGYKMPGGAPYTPKGFEMFMGGITMTHGKTQGVYPAAKAMLSAAYEGALVPFDTAIRIEARWFTNVLMNPSSEAMIRSLFINKQALEKGAVRPAGVGDMTVKRSACWVPA